MKFLKYLLITIVVLFLAFFAIGMIHPEVEYGSKITVSKSIEEAWAVSQDESKFPLWLEGFQSIEHISGEFGEVGSKYKVIVNPGEGQPEFEMIETLLEHEEFDHVSFHFDSEMMDFEQVISFSEEDGMTHIVTESKVIGKGATMASLFALMEKMGGAFTSQETKNQNALKEVIEENTTDYYPVEIDLVLEEVSEDALNEEVAE
jgi:hypothetical protein